MADITVTATGITPAGDLVPVDCAVTELQGHEESESGIVFFTGIGIPGPFWPWR